MHKNILVSIVIPTYNQELYLSEAIDSILNQKYKEIELIVIDDGSTDNTKKIAETYANKIKFISQKNIGQAATLNKGWSIANGELIGYLSSDDRLKNNAVSEMVNFYKKNPAVIAFYCDYSLIDSSGKTIKHITTEEFSRDRMTIDLVCQPGPGAFFKKEAFTSTGGWNPSLKQAADFEFWLRLLALGKFKRLDKNLAEYRVHCESASYRNISRERCEEIVEITKNYWATNSLNQKSKDLAVANAYIIAAKYNFQSGRTGAGLENIISSITAHPRSILKPSNWRIIISGVVRKIFFNFQK